VPGLVWGRVGVYLRSKKIICPPRLSNTINHSTNSIFLHGIRCRRLWFCDLTLASALPRTAPGKVLSQAASQCRGGSYWTFCHRRFNVVLNNKKTLVPGTSSHRSSLTHLHKCGRLASPYARASTPLGRRSGSPAVRFPQPSAPSLEQTDRVETCVGISTSKIGRMSHGLDYVTRLVITRELCDWFFAC
jgi:hypothetical protein